METRERDEQTIPIAVPEKFRFSISLILMFYMTVRSNDIEEQGEEKEITEFVLMVGEGLVKVISETAENEKVDMTSELMSVFYHALHLTENMAGRESWNDFVKQILEIKQKDASAEKVSLYTNQCKQISNHYLSYIHTNYGEVPYIADLRRIAEDNWRGIRKGLFGEK